MKGTYDATGIKAIADALGVSASLTALYLGNNGIGDQGATSIAKALRVNVSLTDCGLLENDFDVGWAVIFNALRDNPGNKITKWDLSWEALGPEIATPLSEYISVSTSLTQVCFFTHILLRYVKIATGGSCACVWCAGESFKEPAVRPGPSIRRLR